MASISRGGYLFKLRKWDIRFGVRGGGEGKDYDGEESTNKKVICKKTWNA